MFRDRAHPMSTVDVTTRWLLELSDGDRVAAGRLIPLIYDDLRRLAARYLRRERSDHTLQPTALVNEAYLRLVNGNVVNWRGRAQFFALAACQIRMILVDHARKKKAAKRGGDAALLTLDDGIASTCGPDVDLLALDEALASLAERSKRQANVVELRFFGGLSVDEAAEVLGVSTSTVKDDWAVARAWLRHRLGEKEST
ncbi:MAG: ECF-type sigma factor [Phycisphaerales bacterium]|nr:ECF-type sigma factor [Phycisphaerales bacterium]